MRKEAIKASVRRAVFAKHDCCVTCGNWDVTDCGHIVSESNGGPATLDNLVPMCGTCNRMLGETNLVIKHFATYSEPKEPVLRNRRLFEKWCGAARTGRVKVKPFSPV